MPRRPNNQNQDKTGFTLIELLVYMGIASVIFLGLTQLLIGSLAMRDRVVARRELLDTVRLLQTTLKQDIRWSESVDQATGDLLELTVEGEPIRYALEGGVVVRQQGSQPPELLTSPSTLVSRLEFVKIAASKVDAPDSVHFAFTASERSGRGTEPAQAVELTLSQREGT